MPLWTPFGAAGVTNVALQPTTVVGYQGPGDIVSGASVWWGLRAYKLSSIGTAAVRLIAPDSAQSDFNTVAGGGLDVTGIIAFGVVHGTPLTVVKIYDQSGNGIDLSQAGGPGFVTTGNGLTLPNIGFVAASNQSLNNASFTFTLAGLPITYVAVGNHTASASQQILLATSSGGVGDVNAIGLRNSGANSCFSYAGTAGLQGVGGTDGNWHSFQAVFTNSTSDVFNVDNNPQTGTNTGSDFPSSCVIYVGALVSANQPFDGFFSEAGIWPVGFNSTQQGQMYTNQHTWYGVF
jgi:hypothetical protein